MTCHRLVTKTTTAVSVDHRPRIESLVSFDRVHVGPSSWYCGDMLRIFTNVDRQDVVLTYSSGQRFPKVEGRLVSVEVGGRELHELLTHGELPVVPNDGMVISWHGKHARRALCRLREVFDAD